MTVYDPFGDLPERLTVFDRFMNWVFRTRLMLGLERRFSKRCGHCGDPLGFLNKGNVCHTCYCEIKFWDEGDE